MYHPKPQSKKLPTDTAELAKQVRVGDDDPIYGKRGGNITNPHGYQSNGFKKNRDVTPV